MSINAALKKFMRLILGFAIVISLASFANAQEIDFGNEERISTLTHQLYLPLVNNGGISAVSSSADKIDVSTLSVGNIIAKGKRDTESNCVFDSNLTMYANIRDDNKTQWLAVEIDGQCQAIVYAKWNGQLEQGPLQFISPREYTTVTVNTPQVVTSAAVSGICGHSSETNEQYIITYGYPGPFDELTRHTSRLTYCYDGVNAQTTALSSTCSAATWPPGYDWVVDECKITANNSGPSGSISGSTKGKFHCDAPTTFPCNLSNPDGYFHTINSTLTGNNNGISNCTWSWSGQVVRGPTRYIVQGCN